MHPAYIQNGDAPTFQSGMGPSLETYAEEGGLHVLHWDGTAACERRRTQTRLDDCQTLQEANAGAKIWTSTAAIPDSAKKGTKEPDAYLG